MEGDVHVVHRGDCWHVVVEGQDDGAASVHEFRNEAVVVGHETARAARAEVLVHGWDGAVRERDSYEGRSSD
jgi:hypothetical protein